MKIFDKDILSDDIDKSLIRIGHIGFIVYFLYTLIFYKERLINSDAAYYTFHMINFEEVFVKHNRYISYFTQWLPLLCIKMGASLKTVLLSYSGIFGVWFYLLFLLNVYVFKTARGGILLLIALVLTMRYKFYAGHTEITFAIAVATSLYNWIAIEKNRISWHNQWLSTLIVILFSAWLYIIHPIIIVPLLAMLIYNVLDKNRWTDYWNWSHISIILFSFALRFMYVMDDGYESNKVNFIKDFTKVFFNPDDYFVFTIIFRYIFIHINVAVIAFVIALVIIYRHKKLLQFSYFLLSTLGLLILVILSHSYLRADILIMIDGYIGMFGMIWGLAILKAFELSAKETKTKLILLASLLFICFGQIYYKHNFYEQRHVYQKELMNQQLALGHHKTLVKLDKFHWKKLWYPYEFPHETIMISALDKNMESATIFVDYDGKNVDEYLKNDYTMLAFYGNCQLNPKYFKLPKEKYIRVDDIPWNH